MKVGYAYAIQVLLDEFRKIKNEEGRGEDLQSLREGIEYLCYPFREDLSEAVRSPLQDPGDPELDPGRADCATVEKELAFDGRVSELLSRHLQVKRFALDALEYIRKG